jgi:hypothetical protein
MLLCVAGCGILEPTLPEADPQIAPEWPIPLRANELSRICYEAGSDSYLVLLDAQRTLYAAQQTLVSTRLAGQANRVNLYKALGGGWIEQ